MLSLLKGSSMPKETMNIDLLPPSNDYVFASLFGKKSHERVLVCLLNSILNGKPHIKSVKLEPTEYKKTSIDGKYKIKVCISGACYKNNGADILDEFEKKLGIKSGEITSDLKFSLESCRCLGSCRKPCVLTINGLVYDNLKVEDVPLLINQCK